MSEPVDTEPLISDLFRQGRFVRSVARELVSGADQDDVVQDTWLTALERKPAPGRGLAAWLKRVARNLALKTLRSARRRDARHARAARPEAAAGSAELSERDQRLCDVLHAVMSLDEPFRTAIVLRFYEGLTPAEIAARLSVPGATVRTRIHRALEQLRTRLDDVYGGDRAAWSAVLVTLAYPQLAAPAAAGAAAMPFVGSLVVGKKILVATLLLCLAGVSFIWWTADETRNGSPGDGANSASPSAPATNPATEPPQDPSAPAVVASPFSSPADDETVASQAISNPSGVRLLGRVVDEGGNPVRNCPVRVRPVFDTSRAGLDRSAPATADVSSDQNGRFAFPSVAALQRLAVTARAPHLADARCQFRTPASGELDLGDLVAVQGGAITGRVVDATGAPIAAATVAAEPVREAAATTTTTVMLISSPAEAFRDARTATTDADGRYTLTGLAAGEAQGRAHGDQHPATSRRGIRVTRGATTPDVDFTLSAGITISGIVRDASGKPLADVRIATSSRTRVLVAGGPEGSSDVSRRTTSDAAGRFTLRGLRAGFETVNAAKAGFRAASVRAPEEGKTIALTLAAAPSIFGRLTDGKGAPVRGATVRIVPADEQAAATVTWNGSGPTSRALVGAEAASLLAEVDDGGWFIAPTVIAESSVVVVESVPGFADARSAPVTMKGSDRKRVDVVLAPECAISCTVTDPAGALVNGATVRWTLLPQGHAASEAGTSQAPAATGTAETGSNGTCRVGNLVPGTYEVLAIHSDFFDSKPTTLVLATPGDTATTALAVARGCAVQGRAFDGHGRPLSGSTITFRNLDGNAAEWAPPSLLTDSQGRFASHGLRQGRYAASVQVPGHQGDMSFAVLAAGIDETSEPAVPATRPGEAAFLADPERVAEIELRLPLPASVSGVVTAAGRPVAQVEVALSAVTTPSTFTFGDARVKTDARGAFYFGSVTAGDYTLKVDPDGAPRTIEVPVTVDVGRERTVDVALPTGEIEGRITDERGAPIPGVVVTATLERAPQAPGGRGARARVAALALTADPSADDAAGELPLEPVLLSLGGSSPHATTDAQGHYRFTNVATGSWTVKATESTLASATSAGVTVVEGRITRGVDLRMSAGGTAEIIVDTGGMAISTIHVSATQTGGGDSKSGSGDTDNPIRLAGLRAGSWHVDAGGWSEDGQGNASADVEIKAGQTTPVRLTLRRSND